MYAATQGPRLESAAEIDQLERDGADLDGILYPMRIRDLSKFGFNEALFPGQDLPRED